MAEENKQQQEGDAPDFAKKHQLEHKWTLWFDNPSTRQTLNRYGQGLRPVYSFDTVEDFWWCVPACSAFGLSCVGASGLSRHACVPFRAAGAPATLAAASVSCSRDCNIQAAGGRLRGHGAYVANSACSPTAADHPSLPACLLLLLPSSSTSADRMHEQAALAYPFLGRVKACYCTPDNVHVPKQL